MKQAMERISNLYRDCFGLMPQVSPIAASGSGRRYFRLRSEQGPAVVGTVGTDLAENEDFFALQQAMRADGTRVPELLAISDDRMMYLQQDLGDVSLFSVLGSEQVPVLVERAIRDLARLQTGLRTTGTAALVRHPFDRTSMLWDLNYFKYCFLKPMEVVFDEWRLEKDMQRMADVYSTIDSRLWGFMYRDCQSRNIMVFQDEIWWIDFQGGRPGPVVYDVVSMLWQVRAGFSSDFRHRMIEAYADELSRCRDVDAAMCIHEIYGIVPLRVLQTLGAYGFRGLTQRKQHFLASIRGGCASLHELAHSGVLDPYPELIKIADILAYKSQTFF